MRLTRFALVLAPLALLTAPLNAQDAAAEEEEAEEEHWAAEVGFALNASGGNEQLTVLTADLGLSHLETSVYEANFGTRFRYGRSEGEEVAQNLRGNVSLDLGPEAAWAPFLFATAENDPFKRLKVRLNGGAGVKRTFWQDGWSEGSLSGAVLYSYENLDVEPAEGDGTSQTARWSWRGRGRWELGEGRRLEQVVYYQPEWDDLGDYLFQAESTARWALTRGLAFNATLLYERDSTPAPDIGPDDLALAIGLTVATRW